MALPCTQGAEANLIPEAYRRYIQMPVSRPTEGVWVPFDQSTQEMMQADYRRLWDTGRLDDMTIAVTDYVFPNGVIGKFVTYTLHERRP